MSQTKAELVNGLSVNAALADAITVDSSGRVGIGTSAVESNLHVHVSSASTGPFLRFTNPNGGDGTYLGRISCGDTAGSFLTGINFFKHDTDDGEIRFRSKVAGTNADVMTLVDGNCGLGTTSPSQKLNINAASGDAYVKLDTTVNGGLLIDVSGTQRGVFANDSAFGGGITDIGIGAKGNMIFRTGTSGYTERMRIASGGAVTFNSTGDVGSNNPGVRIQNPDNGTCRFAVTTSSADTHIQFLNNNANNVRGSITTDGSSTQYNTSSDYRLKENQTAISDGITRIKLLNPYRFNWKEDSSTIVDGFFAHEVSSIVPEAITGEKDAVAVQADVDKGVSDKVGDPIYQQIDQSKLVPLLVAGLQEEIAKREALESRVATLEAA
jgi:hypothetical protein